MYISKLSIRNYRNFRNVSLTFKKGVNTIIGENGCGKTNLFQAMRILIDESMPRSVRFYESDFNRSIGEWKGHWIVIQMEFLELDSSDESQSIAMHKIGNIEDIDSERGTYNVYFRPKIEVRRELYALSQKFKEDKDSEAKIIRYRDILNVLLNRISLNDYEAVFTGRGNVDFSDDEIYKMFIGDFETITFPNPDGERTDIYGVKIYSSTLSNEFACTFAKALRDVESELKSFKDNPLVNLLRDKEKHIKIEQKKEIEDKISILNNDIAELDEVRNISDSISYTVKSAVGETYAPNVNIKSELPSEMEKLLQSLKLWVGDPDEVGYAGRLWELSLGGANLIYLSLKLLEFEKIKKRDKIANFILIEEPEAHIHNHIQKTLFQKINRENTQIFITTHSTHISSVCKISSMNILGKECQKTLVFNPSNGLTSNEVIKLERYLDISRNNLLFAKGVILVEGDAEQILIPALVYSVLGITLDELGISLINIGSTGFSNIAILFHNNRVRRKCSIITDSDKSFYKLPDESTSSDKEYNKSCLASEKSGVQRKKKLDVFCEENIWIKPFYAQHTFEVDFLLAGNSYEIGLAVDELYIRKADRERIKEIIEGENESIACKEVLRLAENFGKGWFAIVLSNHIDNITEIPNYILDALLFAIPKLTISLQVTMAKYRLRKYIQRHYTEDKNDYKFLLSQMEGFKNNKEAIDFYMKQLPNDVLTNILEQVYA